MKIEQIARKVLKPGADKQLILQALGRNLYPYIDEIIAAYAAEGGNSVLARDTVESIVNNLMAGKLYITPSNQLAFTALIKLLKSRARQLSQLDSEYSKVSHLVTLFNIYVETATEKSAQAVEA